MLSAVVLLGGAGTRLMPLTNSVPKPALPFLDKPIISYLIELLKEAGVRRLVLCLGHGSETILELFDATANFGLDMTPVIEDSPLGTGGALRGALSEIENDDAVVAVNGDLLSNVNISAMFAAMKTLGCENAIAVKGVEDPSRFGLVRIDDDGRVVSFSEKTSQPGAPPYLINAGIYIIKPRLLAEFPAGVPLSLERDMFPKWLLGGERIAAYEHTGYWRDIGTLTSYFRAHFEVLHHYYLYDPAFANRDDKGFNLFKGYIYIENSVKLGGKARLDGHVVLMKGCEVGEGAHLSRVIALPYSKIGEGAHVRDAIIGPEVEIAPGEIVEEICITKGSKVPLETYED